LASQTSGQTAGGGQAGEEPTRRDFITLAGLAFAGVGGTLALWPFISQMNPDASTQALASIEVDLAPIKEGQAITVMWRGKPVFIRYRTKEEIKRAEDTPLSDLFDRSARNDALPERAPAAETVTVAGWLPAVARAEPE
jgi:ubiquinol-cytochrome c reductase iron-sulfur subunit